MTYQKQTFELDVPEEKIKGSFTLHSKSGTVVKVTENVHTKVTGGGGGGRISGGGSLGQGYISQVRGHIEEVKIDSQVVRECFVWVQFDDGIESRYPAEPEWSREGAKVTLLWGFDDKGGPSGEPLFFINHNSRTIYPMKLECHEGHRLSKPFMPTGVDTMISVRKMGEHVSRTVQLLPGSPTATSSEETSTMLRASRFLLSPKAFAILGAILLVPIMVGYGSLGFILALPFGLAMLFSKLVLQPIFLKVERSRADRGYAAAKVEYDKAAEQERKVWRLQQQAIINQM